MARTPQFDTEMFDSIEEENAYLRRQVNALKTIHNAVQDDVGWIAFKMGISRQHARRKLARIRPKE